MPNPRRGSKPARNRLNGQQRHRRVEFFAPPAAGLRAQLLTHSTRLMLACIELAEMLRAGQSLLTLIEHLGQRELVDGYRCLLQQLTEIGLAVCLGLFVAELLS